MSADGDKRPRILSVNITSCVLQVAEGGRKNATYRCRVHVTGDRPSWTILRRYRQWDELYCQLSESSSSAALPKLPGKKVLGNLDPSFLEKRRRDLQTWVTATIGDGSFRDCDGLWLWLQPRRDDADFAAKEAAAARPTNADDLPPVMQGTLWLADAVHRYKRWFELRGSVLVWFERRDGKQLGRADLNQAVVATSTALQEQMARQFEDQTGVFFSVVSLPLPSAPTARILTDWRYLFSVCAQQTNQQDGVIINIGAEDGDQMRAWMSALLVQQGDKKGAAAVLTGRASLSSHQISAPSPTDGGLMVADGSSASDDGQLINDSDDPLGGLTTRSAAPKKRPHQEAESPSAAVAAALPSVTPTSAEMMFEAAGVVMTKISVIFASEVALGRGGRLKSPVTSEPEPEPEPKSPPMYILCICECHCEFAAVVIQAGDAPDKLVVLASMPVVGTTQCETDGSENRLSLPSFQLADGDAPLNILFQNRGARDEFSTLLRNAGKAVGPGRQNTHHWLAQLNQAAGRPKRQLPAQQSASSLLQQSSSFFGDVDAAYLLDPERLRQLAATATADSTGAQEVKLVPSSDSITGTAALQTRGSVCDGKQVTLYELSLERRSFRWTVTRRYNDFSMLQDVLKQAYPDVIQRVGAVFPAKGVRSSTNPEVIRERSISLFKWLTFLISDPKTGPDLALARFLGMKISGAGAESLPAQEPVYRKIDQRSLKSVDHLGRTVAELINEHASSSSPEKVLEHLTEFRAFRNSLLTLSFELKRSTAQSVLKLVPDAIEILPERISYTEIVSVDCQPPAIMVACAGGNTRIFKIEGSSLDAHRLAEELDDRVQFTKLILDKEKQLLALGPGELQRQTSAATQRRLEAMTGKTELERIAASVARILSGSRPQDKSKITRPLHHFLEVTFLQLQKEPATALQHVRDVMNDLQQIIIEERANELEIMEFGSDIQAEKLSCGLCITSARLPGTV